MKSKLTTLLTKLIYDKKGRIVFVQLPNLPLVIFIAASILSRVFASGLANYCIKSIALGSILTWASLEIFAGANYFRRILGLVVFGLSVIDTVMFLHSLK